MQLKTRVVTAGGAVVVALGLMIIAKPAITAVFSSPMRDVDNPARQPVHVQIGFTLPSGTLDTLPYHPDYTVPAGQRLVIDSISSRVIAPHGQRATVAVLTTTATGEPQAFIPFQWRPRSSGYDEGTGTIAVELMGAPNTLIVLQR